MMSQVSKLGSNMACHRQSRGTRDGLSSPVSGPESKSVKICTVACQFPGGLIIYSDMLSSVHG